MRSTSAVVVLLALGLGSEASAQRVPPGTRVRLTTPASFTGWHVARVGMMTSDSVRIVYPGGDSATIALANVGLMDSSGGTRTPLWATLSSVVTVPVGGIIGILGGRVVSLSSRHGIDTYVEQGFWVGAAAGLVTGVIIANTHQYEDWNPVPLPTRNDRVASNSRVAVDTPSYRPRMRVKLRVGGHDVVGTLVETRGDSIVVAWNSAHTNYPVAGVTDVRVSRGKSAWTGGKFGALVGAGIGLGVGAREAIAPNDEYNALRDPDCDVTMTSCRYESDVATATKTVAGYTLIGAVAGAVIRREHWVKGALPAPAARDGEPARLLLAPARRGVRIGVHATF